MKVFNSYTQELKEFKPIEEKKVKMYVCGPTVYDFPHLGHARCYITWDMVYRYLKFRGYDVIYARNITDVDDKIIKRAAEENTTPKAIAKKYTDEFRNSMEALNILAPDIEPKATENIKEMINIIKDLVDKGYAYPANGDVYFRVNKFKNYGQLSKQNIDDLEAGARIETSDIKENPMDFALWKAVKDENEISWGSPWGKGRPGWHIECSAMCKAHLGDTIDIHAGGADLLFPHHENEIAQSECANDSEYVKYWLHNGFVTINAEKMSKSLGNFVTINKLLETYDANTIRFFILTNHYRQPVEFNDKSLDSAKAGFQRLKNAYQDVINFISKDSLEGSLDINSISNAGIAAQVKEFIESMDNDFNTSKALACLFELASIAQKAKDEGNKEIASLALTVLITLSEVLGFDITVSEALDNELAEKLMDLIIDIRKDARNEKNWSLSDKIRDELAKMSITIKDTKDGSTWSVND